MKVGSYLFALSPTADLGFAGCKFAPARQKLIRINCTSDFSAECVGALRQSLRFALALQKERNCTDRHMGEPRNRVVQLSRFGGPERPNGQSEAFPRTTWYGYLREFR
jgi:hypothetical protein